MALNFVIDRRVPSGKKSQESMVSIINLILSGYKIKCFPFCSSVVVCVLPVHREACQLVITGRSPFLGLVTYLKREFLQIHKQ